MGRTSALGQRTREAEKEAEYGNWVCGGRNIVEGQESCRASTMIYKHEYKLLHDSDENTTNPKENGRNPTKRQYVYILFVAKENARNPVGGICYILRQKQKN